MKATEEQLATQLRSFENNINSETLKELEQRRQLALHAGSRSFLRRWALPSASAAFASALLLMVFLLPQLPGIPGLSNDSRVESFSENIELYENLEFYSWLAEAGLNESG